MSEWRTSDEILDPVTYGPVDELRGIDLGKLRADAEMLQQVIDQVDTHRHNLDRYWADLSDWDGAAAVAARAHRDRLAGMADRFIQAVAHAPGAILAAVAAIQDALLEYVSHVRELVDGQAFDEYTRLTVAEIQEHYDLMLANLRPLTEEAFAGMAGLSTSDITPVTIRYAEERFLCPLWMDRCG